MTKIICTIGPASKSESVLTQMIKEGMSVARINFSHGTYKEIKERINKIRKVSKNLRKNIPIFADLQGPKIRIGRFKNDKVFLTPNQKFIITTKELKGDKNKVSVDYKELPKFIKPKDKLFLDDGKIELVVEKVKGEDII
ncbi:MAG: pyruvate kinase, partial [Elusimicrobiota bacterium]|nr:pyruvate kinase [Endomicrobiia bacterium]MDW8166430.1 pyruvate kinase [Elusimicrobiota bacterium]